MRAASFRNYFAGEPREKTLPLPPPLSVTYEREITEPDAALSGSLVFDQGCATTDDFGSNNCDWSACSFASYFGPRPAPRLFCWGGRSG